MKEICGIYTGNDIEAVILDEYSLVFLREQNGCIKAYLLATNDGFKCVGVCRTTKAKTIEYAMAMHTDRAFSSGGEIASELGMTVASISMDESGYNFAFMNGVIYKTVKNKVIDDAYFNVECPDATADNIGLCLNNWHLGAHNILYRDKMGRELLIGVEINTKKHMYSFKITDYSIYCRAARYATFNAGVIFNCNFMLSASGSNGKFIYNPDTIYMIEDSTETEKDIKYDYNLLESDGCVFDQNIIYWPLSSFRRDEISLFGSGGGNYYWRKPNVR
jgi:hypothetical protein